MISLHQEIESLASGGYRLNSPPLSNFSTLDQLILSRVFLYICSIMTTLVWNIPSSCSHLIYYLALDFFYFQLGLRVIHSLLPTFQLNIIKINRAFYLQKFVVHFFPGAGSQTQRAWLPSLAGLWELTEPVSSGWSKIRSSCRRLCGNPFKKIQFV